MFVVISIKNDVHVGECSGSVIGGGSTCDRWVAGWNLNGDNMLCTIITEMAFPWWADDGPILDVYLVVSSGIVIVSLFIGC